MKKIILVMFCLCFASQSFAKAKKVKQKGQSPYKFTQVKVLNLEQFKKMTPKMKKEYLKIYSDFLKESEKKKYSVMDFIIPEAHAAYLRNAGFLIDSTGSESYDTRPYLDSTLHSCGANEIPCYPGLGVQANGNAFCVANTSQQTTRCIELADRNNGLDNLVSVLDSRSFDSTKQAALKRAIGENISRINTACSGTSVASSLRDYCNRLNTRLTAFNSKATARGIDPATLIDSTIRIEAPPGAGTTTAASSESCKKAVATVVRNEMGGDFNQKWMAAVELAGSVCSGAPGDYMSLLGKYGVCRGASGSHSGNEELMRSIYGKMKAGNPLTGNEKMEFMKTFGFSVDEYRDLFCNYTTPENFRRKLESYNGALTETRNSEALEAERARMFVNGLRNLKANKATFELRAFGDAFAASSSAMTADRLRTLANSLALYMRGEGSPDFSSYTHSEFKTVMDKMPAAQKTTFDQAMNAFYRQSGYEDSAMPTGPDFHAANRSYTEMRNCASSAMATTGDAFGSTTTVGFQNNCGLRSAADTTLGSPNLIMVKNNECFMVRKDTASSDPTRVILKNPVTGADITSQPLSVLTASTGTHGGYALQSFMCSSVDTTVPAEGAGGPTDR